MIFKSLALYGLLNGESLSPELIEEALQAKSNVDILSSTKQQLSWVSPVKDGEMMTHVQGKDILCMCRIQSRKVPKQMLDDAVSKKLEKLNYKPKKKELSQIRDDIEWSLLPEVYPTTEFIPVLISLDAQKLVIDASSWQKAETVKLFLNHTLDELETKPIDVVSGGVDLLNLIKFYADDTKFYAAFSFGDACKLDMDSGTATFANTALDNPSLEKALASAKSAKEVTFYWKDDIEEEPQVSLTITDKTNIKKVKFFEKKQRYDTDAERVDAEMAITVGYLKPMISGLMEANHDN